MNNPEVENISFRNATLDDMEIFYHWANDKVARSNSFNVEQIDFDTHKKWFEKKISNTRDHLLIFFYKKEPIGQIRIDSLQDGFHIGILIDEKQRGKKLSSLILTKATKYFFTLNISNHLIAEIKTSNKASIKAFESAGFYRHTILPDRYIYKIEEN